MNIKHVGIAVALATGLLMLSGCDQAEKAAQQMLDKTAETAKQAIDDTHKAAEQALNEAAGGRLIEKEQPEQQHQESSHAI